MRTFGENFILSLQFNNDAELSVVSSDNYIGRVTDDTKQVRPFRYGHRNESIAFHISSNYPALFIEKKICHE